MRRNAVLLVPVIALLSLAAAMPARAISDLFDPQTMILPSDVAPGTIAMARSVFSGTEITEFEVEIISVIPRMNLGGDLILCRVVSGPLVERGAGILRGMSGSPVYVDGKMLGAMSSTYAFSKEPLGMITPLVDMLDTFTDSTADDAPQTVEALLDEPIVLADRLVNRVVVTRERPRSIADVPEGTAVFVPVEAPVFMSGLSAGAMAGLTRIFSAHNLVPLQGPGTGDQDMVVDLEPGAAMAVPLMSGDFSAAVSGTVTWRGGDRVLGFGHPFMSAGAIDMPLAGAYVHGIVPSIEIGSKIMSPLATVGAALYDNNWAVGGEVGKEAPVIPFDIEVVNETNGRVGRYHVDVVRHPVFTAAMLTSAAASALEAITYGMAKTTVRVSTELESDRGTLARENTLYSPRGGATVALADLSEAVMVLTRSIFQEAEVTSGRIVCRVTHARGDALIESVELEDYVVRPGQTLRVGVVLRVGDGERVRRTIELLVPEDAPTKPLQLAVCSGGMLPMVEGSMNILWPEPRDLEGLMGLYRDIPPNHQIIATLASASESIVTAGTRMPDLPRMIAAVIGTAGTTDLTSGQGHLRAALETEWAVDGAIQHPIIVVRPEDEVADVVRGSGGRRTSVSYSAPADGLVPAAYGLGGPCGRYIKLDPQMRELLGAVDPYDTLGASRRGEPVVSSTRSGPRLRFQPPARRSIADSPFEVVDEESLEEESPEEPEGESEAEEAEPDAPEKPKKPTKSEGADTKEPKEDLGDLEPTAVRGPKVWTQGSRDDFLAGEPMGISVNELGSLSLTAPLATLQSEFDDLYLWDCALAPDGEVYLGTGREGVIFRVDAEGVMTRFFVADDLMVFSLEVAPDGTLYAGTGPKGLIYRIAPDGEGEILCETGERYVWDLAFDAEGTLYAGTGSQGRLLSIRDGQPEVVYDSAEAHINVICFDAEGRLFAGTGDTGTIIEVAGGGVRTLCESPKGAIHSLALGASGDLFFGAATMDSAGIYRLTAEGDLRTLHTTSDGSLFAMASDGEGRAFAGTGAFARLFVADSKDHVALIGEAEESESQFMAIRYSPTSKLLYACASNPPRLYRADLSNGHEGVFTSSVFDAEAPVRWTGLEWMGDVPEGCTAAVQVRTGNTAAPDPTWSGWSHRYLRQGRAGLTAPDGRYAQYRVSLATEDGAVTPELDAVRVYYLARNARPTIELSEEIAPAVSGEKKLSWTGSDPNDDTLTYALYVSADAGDTWDEVKADLTDAEVTWDTSGHDDGVYVLKLVASDAKQNPTDALEGELVLGPTLIDNTAPKVSLYGKSIEVTGPGAIHVSASATDEGSGVKSAQYRIDGGTWKALPAADGLYDSSYERFEFDVNDLSAGERKVEIVAFDEAGNKTSGSHSVTLEAGAPGKPDEEPAEETDEAEEPSEGPQEPATEETGELTGEGILQRIAAAYEGLKDFTVDLTMTMTAPPGLELGGAPPEVKMEMTMYYARPNKVAMKVADQTTPIPESEKESFWTPESIVMHSGVAKLIGQTTKGGVTIYEVEAMPGTKSDSIKKQTLYIESEHWTVIKAVSVTKLPTGGTGESVATIDYVEVDGFWVPSLMEQDLPKAMFGSTAKGNGKASMVYKNWRINKGVPASVFRG